MPARLPMPRSSYLERPHLTTHLRCRIERASKQRQNHGSRVLTGMDQAIVAGSTLAEVRNRCTRGILATARDVEVLAGEWIAVLRVERPKVHRA